MSNSPFSYENPIMQTMMTVGDLIILNFLFILCCLPVFTIGAAQAGMYTAMRVMRDKEDDSSLVAAFFRGFKNGFGKVTAAWGLMLIAAALIAYCCMWGYGFGLPAWSCILPVAIAVWFVTQIPAIHSRFDCTPGQLIRNSWFLVIAHPIRTLATTALVWLPMVVFLLDAFLFIQVTPLWCVVYYSLAFLFGQTFLAKPFATMVEEYNNRQTAAEPAEQVEEV